MLATDYTGTVVEDTESLIKLGTTRCNKHGLEKPIYIIYTIDNSRIGFPNVGRLLNHMGVNSKRTGFAKRYMNPTKLYKKRYEFHYFDSFSPIMPPCQ
jgi:hypothetical protein